MKKQVVLLGAILIALVTFGSCKKQDEATKPLSEKLFGKWMVEKIVTTTETETGPKSVTQNYQSSDYMDFRKSENNDVEVKLGANTSLGTFVTTVDQTLNLTISGKSLVCRMDEITNSKAQFTGTVTGSNPKVTETYYLYR
ncbi:hypothetical protein [Pedobacter sp.]|uniref:hypothetical protein n=1 Tax=Pedobacter sp. TaxID=1411316 RepID=UPI0031D21295